MVFVPIKPFVRICMRFFSVSILLCAASLFKGTCIIGASKAFFSGTSFLGPLTGAYLGLGGSALYYVMKLLVSFFHMGKIAALPLVYHIPGFCGALSWACNSAIIRAGIPLVCIGLFLVHPTGVASWGLSLYWLIPLAIWALKKRGVWAMALSSTFIMHGVGTVLWLYTRESTPLFWWGLMPVVAFERLFYASAIVVASALFEWLGGYRSLLQQQASRVMQFFRRRYLYD